LTRDEGRVSANASSIHHSEEGGKSPLDAARSAVSAMLKPGEFVGDRVHEPAAPTRTSLSGRRTRSNRPGRRNLIASGIEHEAVLKKLRGRPPPAGARS